MLLGLFFALLSPLSQSVAEMNAILKNEKLQQSLHPSESILEMIKEHDSYLIITDQNALRVEVIYHPKPILGAKDFTLIFHEPTSLSKGKPEPLLD